MSDLQCAARLGVDVVVRTGLREFGVGDAAGTTGDPDPFAETFAAWLDGDLTARIPGAESGSEVVERYEADADGWVARSWAGRPLV